jgi:hypothetical protein
VKINIFEKSKEKKDNTIHTKKWDRCVKDVEKKNKENGTDYNPYSVCTDSIGYEGSVKKPHRKKDGVVNPKMKKKDLMEYINSKVRINETPNNEGERQYFVIREMPSTDKVKIFKFLENLKLSGVINMFGASPLLNWTKDDLHRWLYGMGKDPESIEDEIGNLDDYDEDDEDYVGNSNGDKNSLEEQLIHINYLLDNKQEIRDILVRAAMARIENSGGSTELNNVQRVFEKMAKDSFKMWVSTIYGH